MHRPVMHRARCRMFVDKVLMVMGMMRPDAVMVGMMSVLVMHVMGVMEGHVSLL